VECGLSAQWYTASVLRSSRENNFTTFCAIVDFQALSGIGAVSTSAIVATASDAREFTSARQFAAWLGLVPRQYSTGGKSRLGHITKRGDAYLRTLSNLGARSALRTAAKRADRLARWAISVKQRRGYHRACVAIAAKNARIIWALLTRNERAFASRTFPASRKRTTSASALSRSWTARIFCANSSMASALAAAAIG
jgi:hypothetical protein